jgi:hypothetical protein
MILEDINAMIKTWKARKYVYDRQTLQDLATKYKMGSLTSKLNLWCNFLCQKKR